jgi:hypothetical protein
MCDLAPTHWCMQVEVFLEVATLDISTPLAVDFLPEVRRRVAGHRRTVLRRWCLRHGWRTRRCRKARLLRSWLAQPLTVWRVDCGDDELVDIVTPLLGC